MKSVIFWLALCALFTMLASCATPPEQVAGAITAVGATVAGIVEAVTPLLSPEQAAKLQVVASNIDGSVQATKTAVTAIADVITAMKGAFGSQASEMMTALKTQTAQLAELPSRAELHYTNAAYGSGAVGGSRLLSVLKHSRKA